MKNHLEKHKAFVRDEKGGITVLNVYFTIVLCILAGIAIDLAILTQARTQLQIAADAAGHAALMTRELKDKDVAKAKALEIANANLPASFGIALEEEDILFGSYDKTTHTFTVDDDGPLDSVYVMTERALADANPVGSFLLKFIGFDEWDVRTTAVFETYVPKCFREGFVADSYVDIQSGNGFSNGFCVHSNDHVELNNGNIFEAGVIVSMPNQADVVRPTNDQDSNIGLDKALRSYKYDIKIIERLDTIKAGLNDPDSKYYREWLTSNTIVKQNLNKNNTTITMADLTVGRIHNFNCTGGNPKLTLNGDFAEVGIITNCPIVFGQGAKFVDATIITEDKSDASWSSASQLILGDDDNCDPGGSTQLLSYGSVDSAAGLEVYGSQVIAAGHISFTSGAIGQGAAIVAGDYIDSTSNIDMAYCGKNMEDNFLAEYFRLAG